MSILCGFCCLYLCSILGMVVTPPTVAAHIPTHAHVTQGTGHLTAPRSVPVNMETVSKGKPEPEPAVPVTQITLVSTVTVSAAAMLKTGIVVRA